jgi:hypothetical protein
MGALLGFKGCATLGPSLSIRRVPLAGSSLHRDCGSTLKELVDRRLPRSLQSSGETDQFGARCASGQEPVSFRESIVSDSGLEALTHHRDLRPTALIRVDLLELLGVHRRSRLAAVLGEGPF